MTRRRLDRLLVERGLFASRARAADAVRRGAVRVAGETARKPGQMVAGDAALSIDDAAAAYVSRAALKLLAAFEAMPLDVGGAVCADIGASTGGFTQVLLERGARRVYAIDVGHGQLAEELRHHPAVVNLEGLNARHLSPAHIGEPLDVIVSDVSFISLRKALPAALALARPGALLIALIKPQFEAGREHVGKGGIVRDAAIHEKVVAGISRWLTTKGWPPRRLLPSPVKGADGNREFLVIARKEQS